MALVFVLWLVVLLTAVAFQMTYRGHLRARVTATTGDAAQAFFLARSGIEMAISDLVENATSVADQAALRDEADRLYKNVELGNGTYTLLAGMDGGQPAFGMIDECGKLNINTASVEVLGRLSVLANGMAESIVALREEEESFSSLDALLLIEGVDRLDLYGEDQNGNGLLDSNENDGDQSWPPDDGDGSLDGGLADYLTVWSAARDVDTDGEDRINLNEASAEEIVAALPDINQQQADSIVYHREQNEFSSILDLLEVKLIEKVKKDGEGEGNENQDNGNRPQPQQEQQDQQAQNPNPQGESDSGSTESGADKKPTTPDKAEEEAKKQQEADDRKQEQDNEYTIKDTGKKAFDEDTFKKFSDRVTAEEDEVLRGRINVNTASLEVLACLPEIDESIALAIVQDRQGRVNGFETVFDLLDVRGIDNSRLKGILGHICVRSDVFSVRSFGVLRDGRTFASVGAVLDRSEDEVAVMAWREHG